MDQNIKQYNEGNFKSGQGSFQQSNQQNLQAQPTEKKKNRYLQYLKFLLFSLKVEIKTNEFMVLIKSSNIAEVFLWIFSIIVFFSSSYKFPFVWLQITHLIRGFIGMYILRNLPRTYELVDKLNVDEKTLAEHKVYNDIVREVVRKEVITRLTAMRGWLIFYFCLTIINFILDVISLLYNVSILGSNTQLINSPLNQIGNNTNSTISNSSSSDFDNIDIVNSNIVSYFTYFAISIGYLIIDLAYVFWTHSLKFIFPQEIMAPIYDGFSGVIRKLQEKFKLGNKPNTDARTVDQNIENKKIEDKNINDLERNK